MRFFISGHIDISHDEFLEHYKKSIDNAINTPKCFFIMGDSYGTDLMAFDYLIKNGIDLQDICVYHLGKNSKTYGFKGAIKKGGFKNYEERDSAMTRNSDIDILWVRPDEETKKKYGYNYRPNRISGTEKNRIRREEINKKRKNCS